MEKVASRTRNCYSTAVIWRRIGFYIKDGHFDKLNDRLLSVAKPAWRAVVSHVEPSKRPGTIERIQRTLINQTEKVESVFI